MISLAITAGLLITILYTLQHHLNLSDRQETITEAVLLARMKIKEMEKNPSVTKGYFDKPFSDYYYETGVKESSFPSMIEVSVIVKAGKEGIKLVELVPVEK